ncbi:OsmC family protein [Yokenella regensburgei]|uniref:OsmC family protein n=1 Tax=Yokenella regensburgei TaxID=158877 RepID=UPI003F188C56
MESDVAKYDIVTTWRGGMASQTRCHSCIVGQTLQPSHGQVIHADEPEALGGKGAAPSPQELLLAAFNACMTAAFVHEASRENIVLTSLEIQTWGELSTGIPAASLPLAEEAPGRVQYIIHVSGNGSITQYEQIHRQVINLSPNRWLLARNMTIEGNLIVI